MAVTVVLADDHQILREGLRALLRTVPDVRLIGEAAGGREAIRLVDRLRPNVLVLDLILPDLSGLDVARQVVRRAPATRIVILSVHAHEAYVAEALRAGAIAYVPKESSAAQLVRAIREAAAGRRYLSPPICADAVSEYLQRADASTVPDPLHSLTHREREVLQLSAEGLNRTEISERLFISPRTVESHRANVMRKLNVKNIKELIRFAVRQGILPTER